ncbi:PIPO, partial [Bidens mottle virus]|uniref:PIPO n=1 Tax=Bidens mottle virus TaxID=433357 RepID=UPI0002655002
KLSRSLGRVMERVKLAGKISINLACTKIKSAFHRKFETRKGRRFQRNVRYITTCIFHKSFEPYTGSHQNHKTSNFSIRR